MDRGGFRLEDIPELDHVGAVEQFDELVHLLGIAAERVEDVLSSR
jgi:hypothetical protein